VRDAGEKYKGTPPLPPRSTQQPLIQVSQQVGQQQKRFRGFSNEFPVFVRVRAHVMPTSYFANPIGPSEVAIP
jgi:hypothetical protein